MCIFRIILSYLCQLPDEGNHSLSTQINILVGKCKLTLEDTKYTIKIMLLQHAVNYHEARDWIHLQDQRTLGYQSLLAHCKQLEAHCKQFQQAQAQGSAHLTSITLTSANHSSLHANAQSTTTQQSSCSHCGYSHPHVSCQPLGQLPWHWPFHSLLQEAPPYWMSFQQFQ